MLRNPSIDDVRSYWDRRPCNIRHSPSTAGPREYFDKVEARKYFVEPHIPAFAKFPEWAGKRVLEVGCGTGMDAVNFARAGAECWGMELSETSLALTKQRFAVYGLRGKSLHGNAEIPPAEIPWQYFDLIDSLGSCITRRVWPWRCERYRGMSSKPASFASRCVQATLGKRR